MRPIDLLAHFSNVLLLIAYSLRSMLWLRWFAVFAAITVIPYYVLQAETLWPPIVWACVFMAINLAQIARIYAERRPVLFSADEQVLYDLGFQALRRRDFLSLVMIGEWRDAAGGELLLTEDQPVAAISMPIAGAIRIERRGKTLASIGPGRVIGTGLAFTGNPSAVSASFDGPGRYIRWPLAELRVFLDRNPELRATLHALVNRELAEKLEIAVAINAPTVGHVVE